MQYVNRYKSFLVYESNVPNGEESPKRSERLLTKSQREYKDSKSPTHGPLPSIMFTDIVGSSKLWSADPMTMSHQLEEHHKLISDIATKNKGWIVKTIGDAFMVYFSTSEDSLFNALKCSKEIIKSESKYNLRIGVCEGQMDHKTYKIQNANLKDFFW
jgi:class 3 adenylate cyclase